MISSNQSHYNNTPVNPVIIASDPTFNGGEPTAIRLQNIGTDTFQIRRQEPNTELNHVGESVSFLALEDQCGILTGFGV